MKIEKVIKQLESIADHTRSMAASPDADEIWKEDSDALEFAITALRSMQEAGEPFHIDRSEWKPCVDCRIKCRTCVVRGKEKCARCEKYSEYVPENNFCSNCGRPLTEEAWAELKRRVMR